MLITEILERNARVYPDKVALVKITPSRNIRQQITWKELDQKVNKVANFLQGKGIRKSDKVIHMMMNSIDWIVAYFGILRIGAWVVPLNYRLNSEDIKNCAKAIEPTAFILSEEFVSLAEAVRSDLTTIKIFAILGETLPSTMINLKQELQAMSADSPETEIMDEDSCAIYLTSGTTGTPKLVVFTHKNLEAVAINSVVNRKLQEDDTFLIVGPLYHAGSFMHWLGFLCRGANAVMLIDKKVTPQVIFEAIDKEKITQLALYVPWLLDIFSVLDKGELKKEDYDLSRLRAMSIGAQPVPLKLTERWTAYFSHVTYMEGYGLSEAGGGQGATIWVPSAEEKKQGMIGKAGFNCEARVVNERGEEVQIGEVGEIILQGNTIMKEYYKNPEETNCVLKNGWLHTGDMARVDDEGLIYIVDRKKDVIVCGGENIYPADIEATLVQYPKVYDAALIGIPDDRLGEIPIAVIQTIPGVTLSENEIMEFCNQRFPRYRRPRRIIFDNVPRNATGKIDKPVLKKKFTGPRSFSEI